jgi:hypothetical protein
MTTEAFWIDADYDAEHASDDRSRYGAYIRQNMSGFAECWDGTWDTALPVHFAEQAWRVATGPIMAPGYVRRHPRILSARMEHSYWDGSLAGSVELITPWPQALRQSSQWMKQIDRGWWHDWPMDFSDTCNEPGDDDLSKRPYLLASAALRFTVPSSQLPHPPSAEPADEELTELASQTVAVLVTELNRIVVPVIQTLEAS